VQAFQQIRMQRVQFPITDAGLPDEADYSNGQRLRRQSPARLFAKWRRGFAAAPGRRRVHLLRHRKISNYRTLVFDKPISTTMVWYITRKWGEFTGIGKVSPHDLRRTAITRALDKGLTNRQVQMMSGYKDPKTVMRYDHGRENLEQNAINFLDYDEKQ
jgi:integrase